MDKKIKQKLKIKNIMNNLKKNRLMINKKLKQNKIIYIKKQVKKN